MQGLPRLPQIAGQARDEGRGDRDEERQAREERMGAAKRKTGTAIRRDRPAIRKTGTAMRRDRPAIRRDRSTMRRGESRGLTRKEVGREGQCNARNPWERRETRCPRIAHLFRNGSFLQQVRPSRKLTLRQKCEGQGHNLPAGARDINIRDSSCRRDRRHRFAA